MEEVAASYINYVKSRIFAAVFVDDELIIRPKSSPDFGFRLLCALAAYFVARTDLELIQRSVAEHKRRIVWMAVAEAVLQELNLEGQEYQFAKTLILKQAELFGGVLENKGVADAEAVSKTLVVLSRNNMRPEAVPIIDSKALTFGISALLAKYTLQNKQLEKIAQQARV